MTHPVCQSANRQAALLLVLPGLSGIARAIDRGESIADHLPALARIVSRAEREYQPALDGCGTYCDAIAWLRAREVRHGR